MILAGLLVEEIQEFCETKMGNTASIMALQRKLTRLDDLKYIKNSCKHNKQAVHFQGLDPT